MRLARHLPRWPKLPAVGLLALLPMAVSADAVSLTSSRLTSLTTCGMVSFPGSANLDSDSQVDQASRTSNQNDGVTATPRSDTQHASWTVNQWAGGRVVSGIGSGTVSSNTATVLTLTAAWTGGTPNVGDNYDIWD